MSASKRVAVVSIADDRLNTNWRLREHVAEGFGAVCGSENVVAVAEQNGASTVEVQHPDLVVAFGGLMPDAVDLLPLRRAADRAGAQLAVWLHDDPYELDFAYRALDVADAIFTSDLASLDYYPAARHLPLAASPSAHYRAPAERFDYELFFCGHAFGNRIAFFEDIADRDLAPFRTLVAGDGWPEGNARFTNRRIAADRMPDYYRASMCTLALGRDHDLGNARYAVAPSTPGPRVFEAAMAGCAQLFFVTGLEIEDYFTPGLEIALIDGPGEVAAQLERFIAEPERLRAMRAAAQARALRDHTYAARAATLLEACFPS